MHKSTVVDDETGESVDSRLDFSFSDSKILYRVQAH